MSNDRDVEAFKWIGATIIRQTTDCGVPNEINTMENGRGACLNGS